MEKEQLAKILEAAIMAYNAPLSLDKMQQLFEEQNKKPTVNQLKAALSYLAEQYEDRAVSLQEVASGYRFQSKQDYAPWLVKLWEEKAPKYSRATLETLVLIAYRQPVTRAEIEDVRGVSVSSHIIKSLLEREWIRVVGHRDVPGKPGLYGTTKQFLDYFNLTNLNDLPTLAEVQDLEIVGKHLGEQLDLDIDDVKEASDEALAEAKESFEDTSAEEPQADSAAEVTSEVVEENVVAESEEDFEDVSHTDCETSEELRDDETDEYVSDDAEGESMADDFLEEEAQTKATFFDIVQKFGQSPANDTSDSKDESSSEQQALSYNEE